MKKEIYIRLLNEGTLVYRPVLAVQVRPLIFKVPGDNIFDPENEEWEFLPGTLV